MNCLVSVADMQIEIDDNAPLDETRTLMREYAATLHVSLEIPDFEVELADLPGKYAPPRGRLLVARSGGRPAGCVALRPLGREMGEVKRLYVREEFRGAAVLDESVTLATLGAGAGAPTLPLGLAVLTSCWSEQPESSRAARATAQVRITPASRL